MLNHKYICCNHESASLSVEISHSYLIQSHSFTEEYKRASSVKQLLICRRVILPVSKYDDGNLMLPESSCLREKINLERKIEECSSCEASSEYGCSSTCKGEYLVRADSSSNYVADAEGLCFSSLHILHFQVPVVFSGKKMIGLVYTGTACSLISASIESCLELQMEPEREELKYFTEVVYNCGSTSAAFITGDVKFEHEFEVVAASNL